jgi:hypothetical protein
MGWTFNLATPVGKGITAGLLVLILAVIGMGVYGSVKDYSISTKGSEMVIDAAVYGMNIEKNQIVSISLVDKIPQGSRTNGYGGVNKSFGHFTLDGYGKCNIYIYNKVGSFILLQLKGDSPAYVILNDKSVSDTERLYGDIKEWLK